MRVLLIRPRPHKDTIGLQNVMICEPLELEYVASNIECFGHEAIIIDMIIEKKKLSYYLERYKPQLVGMTGYIAHVNVIKDYARQIKSYDKSLPIMVGGVHAEVNPEDFECEDIDYIIRANGLKAVNQIIEQLEKKGKIAKEENSRGNAEMLTCIYHKDQIPETKETTFSYRYPDRDKVSIYRKKYYYMFHRNCSLIKTSFGCPYQCKFCFCRQVTDGHYFTRTLEDIIGELKQVRETEIYIVDDDFLFNRERLLEFCNLLERNQIKKKYLVYGRADFIAANEDVIKRFKDNGLRAVIVGLESCDSHELVDYNKKSNVELNEKAVAILQKYDVECYGTLILGLDWKKEDFKALGKWIKKLKLVFVNLQPLTPLRGTEMYELYKDQFIVKEEEFEKWDLAHLVVRPSNISVRKYYWYTMLLYYNITANPVSAWYMIKKYGLHDTLKLSFGAMKVNAQYVKKLIYGR